MHDMDLVGKHKLKRAAPVALYTVPREPHTAFTASRSMGIKKALWPNHSNKRS